jgi:hypothetical protein
MYFTDDSLLELLEMLKAYIKKDVIHVRVVLEVA